MSKHTPGPWMMMGPNKNPDVAIDYYQKYVVMGARKLDSEYAPIPAICDDAANARLIASAPEMFDLLKRFDRTDSLELETLDVEIKALLAKIEGDK